MISLCCCTSIPLLWLWLLLLLLLRSKIPTCSRLLLLLLLLLFTCSPSHFAFCSSFLVIETAECDVVVVDADFYGDGRGGCGGPLEVWIIRVHVGRTGTKASGCVGV